MNDTQSILSAIWCELLSLDVAELTPADDFFDRGGDSLLATVAVTRLRDDFGFNVRLRTFFDNPTIESLAAHIDGL